MPFSPATRPTSNASKSRPAGDKEIMTLDEIKTCIKQKPYYEEASGVLYCANCLDILPQIPDKAVDLVLTDPPYGKKWARGLNAIGNSNQHSRKLSEVKWDIKPLQECFDNIIRTSQQWIIWGGNYFTNYLPTTNCVLAWDKDSNPNMPFADFEIAWTSFNSVSRMFRLRNRGFVSDSKDGRFHPTQKPSELIDWVLRKYSKNTDTIFDPFLGSGTTAVAAKQLGRKWVGIEISQKYCDIAIQRLQQEILL
jgi:DNA modification methylase